MRKPTVLVALTILFALTLFTFRLDWPHAAAQTGVGKQEPAIGQKWEYKTISCNSLELQQDADGFKQLVASGRQGWELCESVWRDEGLTYLVLKRPLK